jgi:DNA repair exonuclease SbcCD ATPase subunit
VNPNQSADMSTLNAEIARFREELGTRDKLVQQLSQELFRLVKNDTDRTPRPEIAGDYRAEVRLLREQLQGVEQQVRFYQEQMQRRDFEVQQLRQTIRELTDRSQMLEQVIRELSRVYTQKFAERLAPIKAKIQALQNENRQLHSELVSVNERLIGDGANLQLPKPRVGADVTNITDRQSSQPLIRFSHV